MKPRVILICTLLLLAASPSFAWPICQECSPEYNICEDIGGSFYRCKYDTFGNCYLDPNLRCEPTLTQSTVLSDWKVASIETSCPAPSSVTDAVPAAVTELPTPAPRATELK